jgi:tetratricopeptide (TPR) repeat protein
MYLFLLFSAGFVFSQNKPPAKTTMKPTGPKVYALIVGVADYQYPEMYKPLDYADDDGREFYKYLLKSNSGSVKPENVDTLFNENATSTAILMKLVEIKEKLKEGDLFYFYFSGHGDAYDAELAYLLAYDAPPGRGGKEKNHYLIGSGVVEVYKIKQIFRRITAENVKLVFISDACRTNELAGGTEGKQNVYKRIMEEDAGEIRFTSCASNQKSYEGPQWGGGRGVFSYHFVNGLTGLADEDEDGKVTVDELENYVSKCVKKDTKEEDEMVPKQTPQFGCSIESCDYQILNYVDKAEKEKLILKLQTQSGDIAMNTAKGKGIDLSTEISKYGKTELFNEFSSRLKRHMLIGQNGAYGIYQKLMDDSALPEQIKKELKNTLCIHLNNAVNKVLFTYLDGTMKYREYSKEYFLKAYDELSLYKELSEIYQIDKTKIDANLLFLIGHSYFESEKTWELQLGLSYIDSAVILNPNAAYIYNVKGIYHFYLHQYEKAILAFQKGIKQAPNWVAPSTNLSNLYATIGQQDSAKYYLDRSLTLDTNYVSTYLAFAYQMDAQGEIDSAINYIDKGLEKDPYDTRLLCFKGDLFMSIGNYSSAEKYYRKSIEYDSTDYAAYAGLLKYHLEKDDDPVTDSISYYMIKIVLSDTAKSSTYRYIAKLLNDYEQYEVANTYYSYAFSKDSLNVETVIGWGDTYKALEYKDTAIMLYYYAMGLDSNYSVVYNRIGNWYSDYDLTDDAIEFYLKAYTLDPWSAIHTFNLGYHFKQNKDYANSILYYEKHLKQFIIQDLAIIDLARCYAFQGDKNMALFYLKRGMQESNPWIRRKELKKDEMLKSLRKMKVYKSFLKELKKKEKLEQELSE